MMLHFKTHVLSIWNMNLSLKQILVGFDHSARSGTCQPSINHKDLTCYFDNVSSNPRFSFNAVCLAVIKAIIGIQEHMMPPHMYALKLGSMLDYRSCERCNGILGEN